MQIEVINTGSELLLGSTINTHAAWFGRELFSLGLRVSRQVTVPDGDPIRDAIRESLQRADVLIVTGGLGPTSDDLTREITADVLGIELISDEAAMRSIEGYFAHRGRPMAAANLKQALVPVGADVLPNPNGTAPGVYVPPRLNGRSNCAIFLLPGPPRELYPMYHNEVVPRLRALSGIEDPPKLLNLRFTGIGESDFHQKIDEQLAKISGLEHGYCAHIGEVDLRLIGHASALAAASKIARDAFGDQLISSNGDNIAETVVRMLGERKLTL
ncbi:MAG: competence/damage-inducible protein A, partial [Luteolibacter sp.]